MIILELTDEDLDEHSGRIGNNRINSVLTNMSLSNGVTQSANSNSHVSGTASRGKSESSKILSGKKDDAVQVSVNPFSNDEP